MIDKHEGDFYDYWSKKPRWVLDEAVCLFLGLDPRAIPRVQDRMGRQKKYPEIFPQKYNEYCEIAFDYMRANQLVTNMHPLHYISWADKIDIPVPQELRDLVMKRNNQTNWQTEYQKLKDETDKIIEQQKTQIANLENKKESTKRESDLSRSHSTLLKLFIAMASKSYKYNPNNKQLNVPKKIAEHTNEYGYPIHEDTVRTKIADALEKFPPYKELPKK